MLGRHLVDLSFCNAVQPVVTDLSGEYDQSSRLEVDVLDCIFGCLEPHGGSAVQAQTREYLLKGRMGVHVGRNALARSVVVQSQLVEHFVLAEILLLLLNF